MPIKAPMKPTIQSLSFGIAFDEGLGDDNLGLPPAMRILATLSNHYGELGSEAAFLHKAQLIQQVLEREGDLFPVRVFVRQDTDDVVDASDPDEWQEVFAQAEVEKATGGLIAEVVAVIGHEVEAETETEAWTKPGDVLDSGAVCNSMQAAIARVLDCSKAFYAADAVGSWSSACL